MKEFFLKHSRTWITLFAGLLMVIGVFACCGGFQYENPKETIEDLCDAFCIPGFLLLSFGILVFISNDGGFSMLSYGVKRIFLVFKKDPRMENFYEYKKKRLEKPAPFKYLLVVGSIYFFIGIIFLIIFFVI